MKNVCFFLIKLAFRGDSQLHNGNYVGCIYPQAELDPFLMKHIRRYGNLGKKNVSNLSTNICDEFIDLFGSKVFRQIISEIRSHMKLIRMPYGISIDSTPDISDVDHLTFVIRYVLENGNIAKRFLQFITIDNHDGK